MPGLTSPDTSLHGEKRDFCRILSGKVKFLSPALGKDFCISRIRRKNPDCGACSLFTVLAMRAGHPMEPHWRGVPVLGQGGMWKKMKDQTDEISPCPGHSGEISPA